MTIRDLLADATALLDRAGVEAPRRNAEILLEHVLGTNRGGLLARARAPVDGDSAAHFAALVARRAGREPLQHLVGHWPFLELELIVDSRALVPRPETEDLALAARARLAPGADVLVADIGTGTGCLALALAHGHPRVRVVAVDPSPDALALASANARALGLDARVRFVRASLADAIAPCARLDLIVANLPYVRTDEFATLEPEVRDHDPRVALVAGDEGLALVRALVRDAPVRLRPSASMLLEMAPAQCAVIARELGAAGWVGVEILRDHLGRERIVAARRSA